MGLMSVNEAKVAMKLNKILIQIVRIMTGRAKYPRVSESKLHEVTARPGFNFVGNFSPAEAKTLLDRFSVRGLNFEIVCDTSAPDEASIDGGYSERSTIGVYVQSDNVNKAADIITNLRSGLK
jgi:hypothetical protein